MGKQHLESNPAYILSEEFVKERMVKVEAVYQEILHEKEFLTKIGQYPEKATMVYSCANRNTLTNILHMKRNNARDKITGLMNMIRRRELL